MRWLITMPAWGAQCVTHLREITLPATFEALKYANAQAQILVHTDLPTAFDGIEAGDRVKVTTLPLPPTARQSRYYRLSDCHRDCLSRAEIGRWFAMLNADNVPSIECFAAAARRFEQGKTFVMVNGMRTLSDTPPPAGMRARELLQWSWDHRHPTMEDAVWGRGGTTSLATIYFESNGTVICRGFHLHPFAFIVKPGAPQFRGVTIDDGLIDDYAFEEIHVVTDRDEMALLERSPIERKYGHRETPFRLRNIALWAASKEWTGRNRASPHHRWMFTHRIVIKGTGEDVGDINVCNEVLAMANSEHIDHDPLGPRTDDDVKVDA